MLFGRMVLVLVVIVGVCVFVFCDFFCCELFIFGVLGWEVGFDVDMGELFCDLRVFRGLGMVGIEVLFILGVVGCDGVGIWGLVWKSGCSVMFVYFFSCVWICLLIFVMINCWLGRLRFCVNVCVNWFVVMSVLCRF